jgi:thiazole synthase ThiGH ThiG subunit
LCTILTLVVSNLAIISDNFWVYIVFQTAIGAATYGTLRLALGADAFLYMSLRLARN